MGTVKAVLCVPAEKIFYSHFSNFVFDQGKILRRDLPIMLLAFPTFITLSEKTVPFLGLNGITYIYA
jgi:hypothetical protein